jgi:hypothetical protein
MDATASRNGRRRGEVSGETELQTTSHSTGRHVDNYLQTVIQMGDTKALEGPESRLLTNLEDTRDHENETSQSGRDSFGGSWYRHVEDRLTQHVGRSGTV